MSTMPPIKNEADRLRALHEYEVLDTGRDDDFDDITRLAAYICGTPIALVSLIDEKRQWFKSCHGTNWTETPREIAFCAHAILGDEPFIVPNATEDARFADNPLVTGPEHVRFYAGAPLITPEGHKIGTLCVIDTKPRRLAPEQQEALENLARQVVSCLETRKRMALLANTIQSRERAEAALRETASISRTTSGSYALPRSPQWWALRWAGVAMLLGLVLTIVATEIATRYVERGEQQRFQQSTKQLEGSIRGRVDDYAALLRAGAALFDVNDQVSGAQFQRFVHGLARDGRYRGLGGIGFIEVVSQARLPAFLERARQEQPGFTLRPEGIRPQYYVSRWIEPPDSVTNAVGYDVAMEATRRSAADAARDAGAAVMTAPIQLIQYPRDRAGFLLFAPVATVAQRREAIAGWIYAPVRAIDLMSPLTVSSDLRFRIFDGIPASGAQLFEAGEWTDHDARAVGDVRRIALFGRTWSLEIGSPRTGAVIRRESQIVFFAGLLISGLMATVMIALGSTRRRAHMLADSMTRALRESESRVRSIVDNIADAVITFPSGGSVEAFNLTAEKLFGFSPSEIVGRNVESLLPRIRDAEPTGAAVESVARRRDGSEVPVELALTSFKSGERDVSIAIVRDISERAAVQERLRASEERYRLFFESNPLPSFVWDIATFSILGVNEAASAIYGYSREEFLKMTVLDIRPLEDVPRFMETAAETRPMAFRAGVWRHVRKDGSIIEVDITSQDVQFLGRAARLVVCKDVTDDLAAERKIRESEDRFRDLFENSNDLILSVDRHGRFVFANRAWLRTLGYTAEELRGLVIGDLAHPDCLENCKEILRRVMAGQWINNAEVTFVAKDGRRVVAEGNISGRRDEGGEVISARAIFRDVTERKRAEKELADTLLSLSTVLSSATEIAIIATDLTGMVTVFNSGAERILGFTAAEVIGKQSAYVFHLESELAELREEMTRELGREVRDFDDLMSRARGGGWEREWTYVRKDGEQRRVNLTVTARRDAGGSVIGYLHVAKDVTVQKAVEHALRESEDRLKLMIDNADDIIYRVDTKGRFSFLNATATRLSGFPREVLLGSYYLDFIRPDYRPVTRELYIRQLQERIPNTYHEFPGITADGREVWLGQKVQPFFEHGEIAGFQAVARDITERKRAEDQLRHQLSYTTAIMDSLGEGLCTTDKDGRVTSINPAAEEMLGWGAADLIGQPFHDLVAIHRSGGPRVLASRSPLREALRTARTVRSDEYLLARRDGRLFAVSYTSSPIVVGGEVTGAVLAFRDITEGKKLEEALAQARDAAVQSARLKSEFLANMSHEIRTPMNGVIGMVGLLLGTELSSEQRELAQTVRSSADSLLTIVNDILDFSKIEAGKLSFETSDFDLGTTVEGAVELLAEQARVKKIEVVSLVYSDVPRALRGDAGRLRQVLTNLIGNAVKFTDHGEIVVRVQREGETDTHVVVRISVSDTGMGIDPAAQPRLFTPFTQADGSTTRRYGGTGLGLAICKQLVSMMNGVIGVESERGLGSTFWFTAEFEKQRNPADADRRLAGRRILVVDDSESGRRVFSQQLTSWGMRAQAVTTGWEGTEELKAAVRRGSPYDICVVDMQTPEMDGLHFAAAVGRDRDLQAIPLVLVTSVGKRGDVEGYRSAGFKAVLIKPVKQSFLFETLLELLASGKEERVRPAEAPSVAASATSSPRKKLRVLVAEDNHINQKVALGQLHKLGYPADAVANGLEVLEALERIPYGLVLMDCQMPEMDGYEATAQIRRRERGERRIPIIAMTANAMEGDRERCLDAGMDDYLAKPITERDLGNAIRRWDDELNGSEPAPAAPSLEATIDRDALRGIRELGPNGGDLLDELITIFLEESPSRMTALRLAIDEGDANSAWRTAHTLKSGCSNLGATKMVALCDAIERQARGGSIENLSSLASELDAELLRVSNALQRERVSST